MNHNPQKRDYSFSIIWDDRGGAMDSTKTRISRLAERGAGQNKINPLKIEG
jgi:hypothetical protein